MWVDIPLYYEGTHTAITHAPVPLWFFPQMTPSLCTRSKQIKCIPTVISACHRLGGGRLTPAQLMTFNHIQGGWDGATTEKPSDQILVRGETGHTPCVSMLLLLPSLLASE